eukprot:m.362896 g.362896  ORF g.362896 m.362896 type:complete len:86 (+) comp21130_c0_seq1:205-462(+)
MKEERRSPGCLQSPALLDVVQGRHHAAFFERLVGTGVALANEDVAAVGVEGAFVAEGVDWYCLYASAILDMLALLTVAWSTIGKG